MKRAVIFFILWVMLLGAGPAFAQDAEVAPDFSLQDMNNATVSLSDYKDKQAVILFFWTTWCPYCRQQIMLLNGMYDDLIKNGIEVLAVNFRESKPRIERFAKSYNLKFRILLDPQADTADLYDVIGIPAYILVNKKGVIVFRDNYFPDENYKELLLN